MTPLDAPRRRSGAARGALVAAALAAVGCVMWLGFEYSGKPLIQRSNSVSGGEALLPLLLLVFAFAGALVCGAAAAFGAFAGWVAGRNGLAAGLLAALAAGVAAAAAWLLREPRELEMTIFDRGVPVALLCIVPGVAGAVAACWRGDPILRPARGESSSGAAVLASVAQVAAAAASAAQRAAGATQRAAVPAAAALQRRLPDTLRTPDWANARARWPLLLLLFVALAMFAVFVILAAPDLAPWEGNDHWLAEALNAAAMPWSRGVTAWVLQGGADPFVAALLVGLGLGFNGALLAGLVAGLRRTEKPR